MNLLGRALLAGFSVAVSAGGLLRSRRKTVDRRASPKLLDGALLAGDGTRLPLQTWQPDRAARAVMIALHGFADWRGAFEVSAPLFARRGILVYAYDQRGFGETVSRGTWPGVEPLCADLVDAARVVDERHPDLPLVILGESMGGSLALLAAARADPPLADALLLAAPGLLGGPPNRGRHDDTAFRMASVALPWLRAELQRGGQPWLLPEEAKRFANDPKIVRELSIPTYEGLVELSGRAAEVGRANLPPTLILHGTLDTTVPETAIRHLSARLEPRASLISYPSRHHLLLHEEDVDRVVDDCVTWLDALLPAALERRRARSSAQEPKPDAAVEGEQGPAVHQVVKAAE